MGSGHQVDDVGSGHQVGDVDTGLQVGVVGVVGIEHQLGDVDIITSSLCTCHGHFLLPNFGGVTMGDQVCCFLFNPAGSRNDLMAFGPVVRGLGNIGPLPEQFPQSVPDSDTVGPWASVLYSYWLQVLRSTQYIHIRHTKSV